MKALRARDVEVSTAVTLTALRVTLTAVPYGLVILDKCMVAHHENNESLKCKSYVLSNGTPKLTENILQLTDNLYAIIEVSMWFAKQENNLSEAICQN